MRGGQPRARGGGEGGGWWGSEGAVAVGVRPRSCWGQVPSEAAAGSGEEGAARRATLPRRSLPSPGRFAAALPGVERSG